MGITGEEFNVWVYLIQVAPVVLIMGVVIKALWGENKELNDKINQRDKDNLKTLLEIAKVLKTVKDNGYLHTEQLKSHIDDRINNIKDVIRNEKNK
jgi:tripartite-type tricarboxylate transporter receptor subunit TctC